MRALRQAVRTGPRGHAVDVKALQSLVACRPRGLGRFLLSLAASPAWRTGLRELALALVDRPMAGQLAGELPRLLAALRREAHRSEAGEKVALAAVHALGLAGAPATSAALMDALTLEPLASIRLAAALALAGACDAGARRALRAALQDAEAQVRNAAGRALARCAPAARRE